jgi:hypothetical protein
MLIWGFVLFVCVVCPFGLESCGVVAGLGRRRQEMLTFFDIWARSGAWPRWV